MTIHGGCLCGTFRFTLHAAPGSLADCHCVDCRRSSGAPYVTWGTVGRDEFKVAQGSLRRVPFAGRIRGFAQCCGTHVLFEESTTSATVDVSIATLDDPRSYPPTKAIWTEDKLPWVVLDPRLPSYSQSSEST
jgi:hypothetical protein